MLQRFLSVRYQQGCEYNFVDSTLRSSASARPFSSLRPRPHQAPHPTACPRPPAPRPLLSISSENFQPPRPASRAARPHRRPPIAPHAVRPAIRSTQKLLPAIPEAPAAWSCLPCARSEIPADIPRASAARAAFDMHHSIPTTAPVTNSVRTRWPARNYPDAASSSAYETALPARPARSPVSWAAQKMRNNPSPPATAESCRTRRRNASRKPRLCNSSSWLPARLRLVLFVAVKEASRYIP